MIQFAHSFFALLSDLPIYPYCISINSVDQRIVTGGNDPIFSIINAFASRVISAIINTVVGVKDANCWENVTNNIQDIA
jgi:hypothetical protein